MIVRSPKLSKAAFIIVTAIPMAVTICFRHSIFVDKNEAIKVLSNRGFTSIEVDEYNNSKCAGKDILSTGFKATDSKNKRVAGTVCSGFIKESTVIFN
jgi:hypothetical protein